MKHLDISVFGRVQGVFFRASTKTQAELIGITGWCKNEPDGSVYIQVEGTEEQLKKFQDWCHKGSEFARVERVVVNEGELRGFTDFEIRRY